ncbi:methylated-DNA--[protein]-cysteine S-methyltransferase [Mucilaginibacter sp. dw_454]|uniref:methylated-DNA--[protein]-cysteine S-methyltransferase n=1 Tax=Mucilaginibacter sp. dw_454 TaxID=2720079 RepID=UPI001BD4187C|nr:methylated-DNA--[protein]-cysteine S-methyltransferase [Mucilaginibacter sp. dw_454]
MPVMYYKTPVGIAMIAEDDGFISRVHILDEEREATEPSSPLLQEIAKQFDEYFAGTRRDFDLPIKQSGSDFQQQVWQELLKIEYGKTISYNEQSLRMNSPLAIRAIAAANGRNNLWVVVPCHRVIGSNGSLTGYAGGLWRKKWLLEHEAKVAGIGQTRLEF